MAWTAAIQTDARSLPVRAAAGVDQSPEHSETRVRGDFDDAQIIEVDKAPSGRLKVLRWPTKWRVSQIRSRPKHRGIGIGTSPLMQSFAALPPLGRGYSALAWDRTIRVRPAIVPGWLH